MGGEWCLLCIVFRKQVHWTRDVTNCPDASRVPLHVFIVQKYNTADVVWMPQVADLPAGSVKWHFACRCHKDTVLSSWYSGRWCFLKWKPERRPQVRFVGPIQRQRGLQFSVWIEFVGLWRLPKQNFVRLSCFVIAYYLLRYPDYCLSPWLRALMRGSTTARLLGLRVRIPPGAWRSLVSVVRCQIEVSLTCLALF